MGYITSAAASWPLLVCTLLWRGDCGLQEEVAATGTWGKSRFGAKGDSVGAGWGGGARELVPREGIYFCPILQKVLGQKKIARHAAVTPALRVAEHHGLESTSSGA